MNLKAWIIGGLFLLSASVQAALVEGQNYRTLSKAVPAQDAKKIEVVEFFSFTCVHCRKLDPIIRDHAKKFPKDVALRSVQIVWSDQDMNLARAQYAIHQTGTEAVLAPRIFQGLFDQRINLTDPAIFKNWLSKQKDIDVKKVAAAYDSFAASAETKKMAQMTIDYEIDATPRIIVGGKYEVIPSQGFPEAMKTIDELIARIRQERGKSTAAPVKQNRMPVSKGASLIKKAM